MNISVLLADYAQPGPRNKFTAVGLGWTGTVTPVPPHAVVLLIDSDNEDIDVEQPLRLRLLDKDRHVVTDSNGEAVQVDVEVKIDRDPGKMVPSVTPVVISIANGLPVGPGIYAWQVTSQKHPNLEWTRPFQVSEADLSAAGGPGSQV